MTAELLPKHMREAAQFEADHGREATAHVLSYWAKQAEATLANLSARPGVGVGVGVEDAARWRKVRGMSLADVCVIFNPGMDRDGRNVMRQRDNRVDRLMQPLAALTKEPK